MDHQQLNWYRRNLELKKQRIVDVGANIGALSQFFWDHAGSHSELMSVEPHPKNIKAIEKRIRQAGSKRWTLKRCAVSSCAGSLSLRTLRTEHGDNAQAVAQGGDLKVACQPLSALAPRATVVKLDIEGHEYEVFPEALPRLRDARAWALELHMVEGHPLEDTLGLFASHGYALISAGHAKGDPAGAWLDVAIPATLSWADVPGLPSTRDGLPSVFKMLHVIARR